MGCGGFPNKSLKNRVYVKRLEAFYWMRVEDFSTKEKEVYERLKDVKDPEFGFSIVDRELLDEVKVEGDTAKVVYHLTVPFCPPMFALYIGKEIGKKAKEVQGIEKVEVMVKDHVQAEAINKALRQSP